MPLGMAFSAMECTENLGGRGNSIFVDSSSILKWFMHGCSFHSPPANGLLGVLQRHWLLTEEGRPLKASHRVLGCVGWPLVGNCLHSVSMRPLVGIAYNLRVAVVFLVPDCPSDIPLGFLPPPPLAHPLPNPNRPD